MTQHHLRARLQFHAANRKSPGIYYVDAFPAELKGLTPAALGEHGMIRVLADSKQLEPGSVPSPLTIPYSVLGAACASHSVAYLCFGCSAVRHCPDKVPLAVYRGRLQRAVWARGREQGDVDIEEMDEDGTIGWLALYAGGHDLAEAHAQVLEIERQLHEVAAAAGMLA